MSPKFSKKTFLYFDQAKRNRKNKKWFEANRSQYEEVVRAPFEGLLRELNIHFASQLPRIIINPKKVSQPTFRANRIPEDGTVIKMQSSIFLCEKQTSMFEWNPGIYLSIGQAPKDCVLGLGLYMVSGRQQSLLRHGLSDDFETIDTILSSRKLNSTWGELKGEKFKRFPKGFDESSAAAKYLWHRQFYLGQDLSRSKICSKVFSEKVIQDIQVAIPFMDWVRNAVGTYQGRR